MIDKDYFSPIMAPLNDQTYEKSYIGLDLGTTLSEVAVELSGYGGHVNYKVIQNEAGLRTTPSTILVTEQKEV